MVVLLSLMIWGFIWGVPGCVLAVPITAVLRIYLQSMEPSRRRMANVLDDTARPTSAFLPPPSERPSTKAAVVMYDVVLHSSRSFANRDPGQTGGEFAARRPGERPPHRNPQPQANDVLWVVQYGA